MTLRQPTKLQICLQPSSVLDPRTIDVVCRIGVYSYPWIAGGEKQTRSKATNSRQVHMPVTGKQTRPNRHR